MVAPVPTEVRVTIYLMRHARAGRRSAWDGPDEARPVSKVGRRQAKGLAEELVDAGISVILSSPYVRCRQTVEPLAKALALRIDVTEALTEGADLDGVLALLGGYPDEHLVACTHGDIALLVLARVRADGVKLRAPKTEKGSVWALEHSGGRFTSAVYHRPPDD